MKETIERTPEENQEWFTRDAIETTIKNTQQPSYLKYPDERLTLKDGAIINDRQIYLPDGKWYVPPTQEGITEDITIKDLAKIDEDNLRVDQIGRPVHPWIKEIVSDEIGIFTGKGFFWHWGPNKTVDPIVFRHDLDQPHVMLIVREDTSKIALPGGFHDPGETYVEGATREADEETLLYIGNLTARFVYSGPLADNRATANAWPHTDAFRFDLPDELAKDLPMEWEGGEEVEKALWAPLDKIDELVFGSHNLLIELAAKLRR